MSALRISHDEEPREPRSSGLGWLVGLGLVAGACLAGWRWQHQIAGILATAPAVEVATVLREDDAASTGGLSASGYVIALRRSSLGFKRAGRIAELAVEDGQRVRAGEVLARLESGEPRAEVGRADAAAASARARLSELEAGSRRQEIAKARANLAEVEARLSDTRVNRSRSEKLHERGAIPRRDLDAARMQESVARAQVDAARQVLSMIREGPRREEIDHARARLREAEAALSLAHVQLDDTSLVAPFDGTIIEKHVEVGEPVAFSGSPAQQGGIFVYTIADLGRLEAEVDVSETNIRQVREGAPALVAVDAYPDRRYRGRVRKVMPRANRQKAIVPARVTIQDPDDRLRPDLACKVTFLERPVERLDPPRVLVPARAVVSSGDRTLVFVVQSGVVRLTPVTLAGPKTAGQAGPGIRMRIVEAGLAGGESVVLDPLPTLRDGQKVQAKGLAAPGGAVS